ncbi:DNA polymerase IV [Hydrogenimonas thermophila]|uniref:Y-family DNA polymerase n=1 Tax=Hydrogenimonas thermophila TaxID=223786 RepID=UPI0029373E7D|nr:DNA polymerase IV [Hydrogenimonas thermophila]WOE70175.1 DNA polymerase IV [Hydrogenimonas thermophila]WOE72692.1 DNA polymerase IV [Hydrogenimonas thermophila]
MIIHLDLDCFFASCERLLNPVLKNRPIAVGGRGDPFIFSQKSRKNIDVTLNNKGAFVPTIFYDAKSSFEDYFVEDKKIRGIVITSSYEARSYGVKTGMTIYEALRVCPNLIVLPPNHLFYHEQSYKLKKYLLKKIPVVEQYSVDEFFGDLKGWCEEKDVLNFIEELQCEIEEKFGLPISIGAAPSKWIAKMATSEAKPNGCKVIFKKDIDNFIDPKPIDSFPGIGKGFAKRLKEYKIETLGDLKQAKYLLYRWKKPGIQLYHRVNGDDKEPIQPNIDRRSIGISRTIDPVFDRDEIRRRLTILCRHLAHLILKIDAQPKTVYLGIKYQFGQKAKRNTTVTFNFSEWSLRRHILELLDEIDVYKSLSIIRLSINCSNFENRPTTRGSIFEYEKELKEKRLFKHCAKIRQKYGVDMIKTAVEIKQ